MSPLPGSGALAAGQHTEFLNTCGKQLTAICHPRATAASPNRQLGIEKQILLAPTANFDSGTTAPARQRPVFWTVSVGLPVHSNRESDCRSLE